MGERIFSYELVLLLCYESNAQHSYQSNYGHSNQCLAAAGGIITFGSGFTVRACGSVGSGSLGGGSLSGGFLGGGFLGGYLLCAVALSGQPSLGVSLSFLRRTECTNESNVKVVVLIVKNIICGEVEANTDGVDSANPTVFVVVGEVDQTQSPFTVSSIFDIPVLAVVVLSGEDRTCAVENVTAVSPAVSGQNRDVGEVLCFVGNLGLNAEGNVGRLSFNLKCTEPSVSLTEY